MTRGSAREKNGRFYIGTRYGKAKRLEFRAPWVKSQAEADARAELVAAAAEQLVAIGRRDLVRNTARELAEAATSKQLETVQRTIAAIVSGARRAGVTADVTIEDWGGRWTNGELTEQYPDHVPVAGSERDAGRLRRYVYKHVGDVPVGAFRLAHAELVMSRLPKKVERSRRHIAQLMVRLLNLAVYPGCLIATSPIPRGWLPKVKERPLFSCLFPREELLLLRHADTPEALRLFFGVLDREGMRLSELLDSEWWQWNLEEGVFTTTKNKQRDPRFWALKPDVVEAMQVWKTRCPPPWRPFTHVHALGDRTKLAERLRFALKAAGVERKELFESTAHTGALRAHDLRATFVTISIAEGRPDTWIRDRTGHRSTAMIDRYRRQARQYSELRLGSLPHLRQALGWRKPGGKELESGGASEGVTDGECTGRDSNPHASSAVEPKSPRTPDLDREQRENTAEDDVSGRPETPFRHPSATPLPSFPSSDGGSTGELEPTTRAAAGLALQRAMWDGFDAFELADVEERDAKPENVSPGPKKARERVLEERAPKRRRGAR